MAQEQHQNIPNLLKNVREGDVLTRVLRQCVPDLLMGDVLTRVLRQGVPLLLAVIFLLATLCSCNTTTPVARYESPYNWDNLSQQEGRYVYTKDRVKQSRSGIDVSEFQGIIDWTAVAYDSVEFAFIRVGNRGATEGDLYTDEHYWSNITGAQAVGVKTGVYFFSQAITEAEAVEEAEFVLAHLKGIKLDYPVVFDHEPVTEVEGRANKLSGEQISACAKAFCDVIERAGYDTMIYGNKQDIAKIDPSVLQAHEVWFAEYDAKKPTGQFDFTIWQYANNGNVSGISTPVDMNIHFLVP